MKRAVVVVVLAACAHAPPPPPPAPAPAPPPPPRTVAPAPAPSAHEQRFAAIVAAAPTPTAAFFVAKRELGDDPALAGKLAMLGERAADAEIEHARAAKGPGGAWLHAALAARIAGGKPPRRAAAALDAVTLPDFDLFPPPASCSWLGGPARQPTGRHVEVRTTNLACQQSADGTHARISGSATIRWEVGDATAPITIEVTHDRADAAPGAVLQLNTQLDALVRDRWAATFHFDKASDPGDAENAIVILARLGHVDPAQVVRLMEQFGITYAELDQR